MCMSTNGRICTNFRPITRLLSLQVIIRRWEMELAITIISRSLKLGRLMFNTIMVRIMCLILCLYFTSHCRQPQGLSKSPTLTKQWRWGTHIRHRNNPFSKIVNSVHNKLNKPTNTNKSTHKASNYIKLHLQSIHLKSTILPILACNSLSTWLSISSKDHATRAQSTWICDMVKGSSSTRMEACMKVINLFNGLGNWKLNKMDGFGKLYYQSGKIAYEGNWNEDQFQGYGMFLFYWQVSSTMSNATNCKTLSTTKTSTWSTNIGCSTRATSWLTKRMDKVRWSFPTESTLKVTSKRTWSMDQASSIEWTAKW